VFRRDFPELPRSYAILDSPIGPLTVVSRGELLAEIWFPKGSEPAEVGDAIEGSGPLEVAFRQLEEYFRGERTTFDLELAPEGTLFQLRVWEQLLTIPFGETRSYGQIAQATGQPDAARGVGAANGSNPIPIVIPCHRVIGASGALTGFGGGLDTKRWLLAHEQQPSLFRGSRWSPASAGSGPP